MTLKVYNVILHRLEDLDAFYADMETPGGSLYIPNRAVDYAARLPLSRITPYRITDEEAALLRQDPRVKEVEPALEEYKIFPNPAWEQNATFRKDSGTNIANNVRNWALWQCTQNSIDAGFGVDGTIDKTGTVSVNTEGLHVDVVIVDGIPSLDHPEFAVNADGTGGSRIIQYNWFQHTDSVTGGIFSNGVYDYTTELVGDSSTNNHGAHVMGTVVGNTQGWARKANVYVISPYSSNYNWVSSGVSPSFTLDYVRRFHANKPINPVTGRKNPTIVNNSWGYSYPDLGNIIDEASSIEKIVYRGTTYENLTTEQMLNFGIPAYWALTSAYVDYNINFSDPGVPGAKVTSIAWALPSVTTKTQECIDDGIIVVGASGNNSQYIDSENGPDYNNKVYLRNKTYGYVYAYYQGGDSAVFYHRGSAPGNTGLCIGNASIYSNNQRDFSSNFGPRIDIYAPGNEIISAVRHNGIYDNNVADARNGSFYQSMISGTSMASPQVTGVLACALQAYPDMTQAEAKAYLQGTAFKNIMFDSALDWGDVTAYGRSTLYALSIDLKNTPNLYLRYKEERLKLGTTVPKLDNKERPTIGLTWPRVSIVKTRRTVGEILYPTPGTNLEAPLESLVSYEGIITNTYIADSAGASYQGDFITNYVSVATYLDSVSGVDYSPSYASVGYLGDYLSTYTGAYASTDLEAYVGGSGLSYQTSYIGDYVSEGDGAGGPIEYISAYGVSVNYTTGFSSTYLSTTIYEGDISYLGSAAYTGDYVSAYTSGDTYLSSYLADSSAGGGEIFLAAYLGSYVGDYSDAGETTYVGSYDRDVLKSYTSSFTEEYIGN